MKGLDTNVLLRYLVQDDPDQAAVADQFIESECTEESPGFISLIVLCELVWVLKSGYEYKQDDVLRALQQILRVAQFQVESPQTVHQALVDIGKGRADFSDYLLARVGKAHGCQYTATFDKKAGSYETFRWLTVE